ncbi:MULTISPECIES: bifunctional UDP-sugar hydrolase/5'-nucleotidase [unclassified Staphylococcus]|uniref:bifunctional metallophosphatase/5'-nucleotidase n=1 Tax=unclassified Staphylococcus TaxID=91994 RepID=UPI0021D23C40|nr:MULTISPECIES: bifunctional UDP-sugar hydrolase/5'-nucleotidase [unclassified Staphylococcus]UXR78817.1 bifunctional metallophosphatase/5'-nucleotidase [Staphylococcus sp. IVB6227]UXR82977.1 bifunctional metallophosphatase/5'-nucleotidase [Staphylococcus sp. IVB6214]
MRVTLYHTNDIHSHLDAFSRIKAYMAEQRPKLEHPSLYLDIGDHVDLSLPVTEGTMGKRNVQLLNEANCDVATIGNNEGMTISHDVLNTLYDEADFTVTCANVFDESGQLPNNFVESHIKEVAGVRFLFVGVTAAFTPFYRALDWLVTDPLAAIQHVVRQQKGQYDVLIVMSHAGIFFDEELCKLLPEADVILGSHTHHHFLEGKVSNGVLMAAAGKYGHYLGEVTLEIEAQQVVSKRATLHALDTLPVVTTDFEQEGRTLLNSPVVTKPMTLQRETNFITEATYRLAQSVHDYIGADCTIINAGLMVKGYEHKKLTEYDIHQMLPHPINTVRARVSGRVLKDILMTAREQAYMYEHAQGLGFRGDIYGGYILYNAGYIDSSNRYFVNGIEIQDDETYLLGTVDMYTFGRYFPMLKGQSMDYIMPAFLRDIFKAYLQGV